MVLFQLKREHRSEMWFYCWVIASTAVAAEWIQLPHLTPKLSVFETLPEIRNLSFTPTTQNVNESLSATNRPTMTLPNGSTTSPPLIYSSLDPTLESVLLKVHQTLVKQGSRPLSHKIQFLKNLQNGMLHQIRKKSLSLWTEKAEGRGSMLSFPSVEGALMTISFLTFAVFLIKIVRQFIQGLQSVNGTTTATTTPVITQAIRHKRDWHQSQLEQILDYIEEFKMMYEQH